jgi:hypothetical protein
MADYELNKDYITKNFCVNKAKPMMHCNGKCHMRKELAQQDKKENSLPYQNFKYNEPTEISKSDFIYSFFIPKVSASSIFHPPQV